MPQVRIWWDPQVKAYQLTSPYSKDLVEALKLLIPASDRAFNPATKVWTFIEKWLQPTEQLLKTMGFACTPVTKAQVERAGSASNSTSTIKHGSPLDTVKLDFVNLLPYEAAQAAYRKASMILHPDRGGDMDAMQRLNIAWQKLEKEHFKI